MTVRLAIHPDEKSFSKRWVASCDEQKIPYQLVNCLDSGILSQLASADALLWHWHFQNPGAQLMARQLMLAAETGGLPVFPNAKTCWHYDDKVGQRYLLEAVGAPLVPSYVFYELTDALAWIDRARFPKVFKLRTGAGSSNVRLVHDAQQARALAKQSFARGFKPVPPYHRDAAKRLRIARQRRSVVSAMMRVPRTLANIRQLNRAIGRERGYVYFQDFIPDNQFDTRVTVIGNRAFAFTRNVRAGDFRASGSGDIVYDAGRIHPDCLRIAFDVTRKVGSQSMAFDFVLASNQQPLVVEVSYCYQAEAIYRCAGYWDDRLEWHEGSMWPQDAILIDLVEEARRRTSCARGTTAMIEPGGNGVPAHVTAI